MWLNDGVLAMEKLHVSAFSGHLQVLATFLLKECYIIFLNYYIICKNLKMADIGRNM